jgi:MFS family permease
MAWAAVGAGVIVIAAASFFLLPRHAPLAGKEEKDLSGLSLAEALRTPVFWVFGGAIALFGLVSAGVGLFNEAVLAERGFDRETYHNIFLPVMAVTALLGQFLSGWMNRRCSLARLLAIAMFLHAGALAGVPVIHTLTQLSAFAVVFGVSTGIITVVFFAVWSRAFGQAHLGRIQGAAQALSVFASALGPLVFAATHAWWRSYTPALLGLALPMLAFGMAAWFLKMKPFTPDN